MEEVETMNVETEMSEIETLQFRYLLTRSRSCQVWFVRCWKETEIVDEDDIGQHQVVECGSGDLEVDAVFRRLGHHLRSLRRGHHRHLRDLLCASLMTKVKGISWKGSFSTSCMRLMDRLIAGTSTRTFYLGLLTVSNFGQTEIERFGFVTQIFLKTFNSQWASVLMCASGAISGTL
jgi:hypothetical protein